uniref:Uncharacterized protein n=1 Tax=Rhizophora mucronata TaxID=61149 RepID=A0A2P2PSC1_RHIMU
MFPNLLIGEFSYIKCPSHVVMIVGCYMLLIFHASLLNVNIVSP